MRYKYGIDFGTTNSSIALTFMDDLDQKKHTIVFPVAEIKPFEVLPSIIYVDEHRKVVVGSDAKHEYAYACKHDVESSLIKRIKLSLEDNAINGEHFAGTSPESFRTVDLIASLFGTLKRKADEEVKKLGVNIDGVVVGVPVEFDKRHKEVLINALLKAGFYHNNNEAIEKTEFLPEPIAVALHYGFQMNSDKTVMIFDFGGGTLDIAIINLKNERDPHETLSKERLTLGGEELTHLFFVNTFLKKYDGNQLANQFGLANPNSLSNDEIWELMNKTIAGVDLIEKIDEMKCALSYNNFYKFSFIGPNGIELKEKIFYREDFEESIESKMNDIETLITSAISNSTKPLSVDDIDSVLIAGGSSLIPKIQEILISMFGRLKVQTKNENEVFTSIVRGLAIQGSVKKDDLLVHDITDSHYGYWDNEDDKFEAIIKRGTKYVDTKYDKMTRQGGRREKMRSINPNPDTIDLQIYQANSRGQKELKTIRITNPGSGRYEVFMTMDEKKGWLIVDIYDRIRNMWFDDIPLEDRTIKDIK